MPKVNSESLFRIIKSLTRSEKGYFKKFAVLNTSRKDSNYLKLFDVINKQTEYDERRIIEEENLNEKNNQFPKLKNYLYNLVLQSLESYHSSKDSDLRSCLSQSEILFKKGLYREGSKLLMKAKHMASKYENYEMWADILKRERNLIISTTFRDKHVRHKVDAFHNERQEIFRKIKNVWEYQMLADKMYSLRTSKGDSRSEHELREFKNIMDNPLLRYESKAITRETKQLFAFIHAIFYEQTGNLAKSYDYRKKIVGMLEAFPEQIKQRPNTYLSSLNNVARLSYKLGMYNELPHILKKMRAIPGLLGRKCPEDLKARIFERSYNLELNMYLSCGRFEKAISLFSKVENGLEEFRGKTAKEYEIVFYSHFSLLYFIICDYKKALLWNNKILNDLYPGIRQDIYCSARIFNLIIHYQLDNEGLLGYLGKTTHYYLGKRDKLYKTEASILDFFRKKLPKAIGKKELINAFKALRTELEKILNDPFEKQTLNYFDIISWLESKIEDRPFAESLRRTAKPGK